MFSKLGTEREFQEQVGQVFSSDHHFEQAGFVNCA
jgi:hypothetical protein